MVMVTESDLVLSVALVAVSVTVFGLGLFAGGMYVTLVLVAEDSVPQIAPVQPPPVTFQVTPAPVWSFVAMAVNCVPVVSPALIVLGAGLGEMATTIAGNTVMVALADLVLSLADVAVSVTVLFGEGGKSGAM